MNSGKPSVKYMTYILNALPVDGLASFTRLLADHNALQHGVDHGDT